MSKLIQELQDARNMAALRASDPLNAMRKIYAHITFINRLKAEIATAGVLMASDPSVSCDSFMGIQIIESSVMPDHMAVALDRNNNILAVLHR